MGAVRSKEFHFPLDVEWTEGRRVRVDVPGKAPLAITPPPEFKGTEPDVWSPEDLLVGAAASCLAVTFTGIAQRRGLAYSDLAVHGDGVAGMRDDGRFGFTRIDLELTVDVAAEDEALARELAEQAEAQCLVSASLDLPVEAEIDVRVPVAG